MYILGIVGGIACGKSTVSDCFHNLGAGVIKADPIVHEVLEIPEIIQQMHTRWKNSRWGITNLDLTNPAKVDRRKIAEIVFNDDKELKFLEAITWPEVNRRLVERMKLFHPDYNRALILDAPLLFETGWNVYCDKILFVDMPYDDRLHNFLARSTKHTKEDFDTREKRQVTLEEKRQHSHLVITNVKGHWEDTQKQIQTFWKNLPPLKF